MNKLFFIALSVCMACSDAPKQADNSGSGKQDSTQQSRKIEKFLTAKVLPNISLSTDSSQSFALYVPKGYNEVNILPVIIFFDPQGEGALPLKMYGALADEFNVILAASNSCRNGVNMLVARGMADALIDDVVKRLPVDPKNITLAGFSGGSKVAMAAAAHAGVTRMIYCGAVGDVEDAAPVSYFGIAGKKDMNYTDLIYFNNSLPATGAHYLIEWDGAHEWPKPEVFREALQFHKNGTVENYEAKQPRLNQADIDQEQKLKQKFIAAFQTKEMNWWKNEIALLRKSSGGNLMDERVLGFISLACYSIINSALQQNDLLFAEKTLGIYKLADPKNKAIAEFAKEIEKKKGE